MWSMLRELYKAIARNPKTNWTIRTKSGKDFSNAWETTDYVLEDYGHSPDHEYITITSKSGTFLVPYSEIDIIFYK